MNRRSLPWASIAAAIVCLGWQRTAPDVVPKRITFICDSAANVAMKDPTSVWYDTKHSEILVADTGNNRIVIFDTKGSVKAAFVHYVDTSGGSHVPGEPKSIAVDSRGDIYIVDRLANYVDVCDYRGRTIRRITVGALLPASETQRVGTQPNVLTLDKSDNLYLATTNRVYVITPDGELTRTIGRTGTGEGQFLAITSLSVDVGGKVYVTDAQAIAVQVFSPEGTVLLAFGEHTYGFTNFSMPSSIATDRNGVIWVADSLRHVVSAFKREGKDVRFLDYIGAFGHRPGEFSYPTAIAVTLNGRLVVVDRGGGRLQCFEQ